MHEEASTIIISNGILSVTSSPTPHTPTAIINNINNCNIVATTSTITSSATNVITTNYELNNDLSSLPSDLESVPVTTTSQQHTVIINNGDRGSECINLAPDQSLTNNVEIEIQDIPFEGKISILELFSFSSVDCWRLLLLDFSNLLLLIGIYWILIRFVIVLHGKFYRFLSLNSKSYASSSLMV